MHSDVFYYTVITVRINLQEYKTVFLLEGRMLNVNHLTKQAFLWAKFWQFYDSVLNHYCMRYFFNRYVA